MPILERPLKFSQTANREEMSGGGYLALLIKTKQTRLYTCPQETPSLSF